MATWARVEASYLKAGAVVVIALVAARALFRCDDSWDSWAYHLVFAARLWDIVPRSSFEMDDHLEVLFGAYPVGVEWIQGALWKLTGRPQAATLVGLGAVLAFVELLHRRFAVERAHAVFALLAIPMVQIHASIGYVDLPANVAAAAAALLAFRAWTARELDRRDAAGAAVCAAFAASAKYQVAPVAGLVALALTLLLLVRREARTPASIAVHVLACLVGAYPYLRNALLFGAPFHPLAVASLGSGQGALLDYQGPRLLEHWPGAARWVLSVIGVGELEPARGMFSLDAAPGDESGPTSRMGGYFGPWVACQLVFLWRLNRSGSRASRGAVLTVLGLSLLTAFAPQAHQLRYYAYWMMTLVALNLTRATTLPEEAAFGRRLYARLSLAAFGAVVLLTGGRHLNPTGPDRPLAGFVEDRIPTPVLGKLQPGGRYCLVGEPFPPLVLSAELLGRRPYSLKSSWLAEGCADRVRVHLSGNPEEGR